MTMKLPHVAAPAPALVADDSSNRPTASADADPAGRSDIASPAASDHGAVIAIDVQP